MWRYGQFSIGPLLGFQSEWSSVALRTGDGPRVRSTEWRFRTMLHLEARLRLTERFGLMVGGGGSLTPNQDFYRRASDEAIIYKTPLFSLDILAGVTVAL